MEQSPSHLDSGHATRLSSKQTRNAIGAAIEATTNEALPMRTNNDASLDPKGKEKRDRPWGLSRVEASGAKKKIKLENTNVHSPTRRPQDSLYDVSFVHDQHCKHTVFS